MKLHKFVFFLLIISAFSSIIAQTPTPAGTLVGRWEVLQYAEQGLQVDKKKPALPQAHEVYPLR